MAINFLSKLNLGLGATAAEPKAPQAAPQANPAAPQKFQADAFVKTQRPGTGFLTRPGVPAPAGAPSARVANPDANLGFQELLAKNPAMIWNTQLTPRTEQALAAFKRGVLGRSVRDLDLRNKTAEAVRTELKNRGFKAEMGVIKDVRTGQPVINPATGRTVPMEIWTHADGGMVRIKPEGDPTNRFRPQAHLSISVLYPPGSSGHDFNNEAFKVDHKGNPLPKWSNDARNPFAAATPAGKKFLDDLASQTHVNLR